jgi:rRNA biogenesis protein RRP5
MTEALPRGRGPLKPLSPSPPKPKLFGFKNKLQKLKKQKKPVPKIQSRISIKDYAQGCLTLGCVRSVQDDIVYFDLPGGFRGVLLLTEINDSFLERLRVAVEEQSNSLPNLEDFFTIGAFFDAVVLSQESSPVELSIRPQLLNVGLKFEEGLVLVGAVKSKVDHGFIVDLGHDSIQGFLPNPAEVAIGQPLRVRIIAVSSLTLVRLEICPAEVFYPTVRMETIHFDMIRPYTVLRSVVQAWTTNGALKLLVAGAYGGTCARHSWLPGIEPGEEVDVRPLLIDPAQKLMWMSAIPSIVEGRKPVCFEARLGATVDAIVTRIRLDIGIDLEWEGRRLFVDFKTSQSSEPVAAGDIHRVRIVQRMPLDDLLMATDDADIISLSIFVADDVVVGSVIDGTVANVHEKFGIFVKLSPFLSGLCPTEYCEDVTAIKPGMTVQAVVLAVNNGQVRIALNNKLVNSRLPKVTTLEVAHEMARSGEFTHVIVRKSVKNALLVELYNALFAMIPSHYLPIERGQDVSKSYHPGHVLRARVASVDGDKINCSVTADQNSVLRLGLKLACTVTGFGNDDVKISLPAKYGQFNAVIPNQHFSDFLPLSLYIRDSLQIGRKLHNCVLVRLPGTRAPAVFTRKRCYRDFAGDLPLTVDVMEVGQSHFGYVSGVQPYGSFVTFYGQISGLIAGRVLAIGESVHPVVTKVESSHISLALGSEAGESIFFLQNFIKDCRDFAPAFVIGDELTFETPPQQFDDIFVYSIGGDWTGRSTMNRDKLRVAYLDVITKVAILDEFSENEEIEPGTPVLADVLGVFNPVIVAKAGEIIVLAPLNNYNSHEDRSQVCQPGSQISLTIEEVCTPIYLGVPSFLTSDDPAGTVTVEIWELQGVYAKGRLPDRRTAFVHRAQLPGTESLGDKLTGRLIEDNNRLYLVVDETLPQRLDDFAVGQHVAGIVRKVFPDFLKLSLSRFTDGALHALELTNSDRELVSRSLEESYSVGDRIEGYVISKKDPYVILSAFDPSHPQTVHFAQILHIKPGDCAEVSVGMGDRRRLDVVDVVDEFVFDPLSQFKEGDVIDVCFVPGSTKFVSTRPSAFEGSFPALKLSVGSVLKGYVSHATAGSLLVRLARGVTGKLPFGKVADPYVQSVKDLYPFGSVVDVKIESVDGGVINLTARATDIAGKTLAFEDLTVGEQVQGVVTGSSQFGIFVSLSGFHKVSGLVHRSNLEIDRAEWPRLVNRRVLVSVDAIDTAKKRVNLRLVELYDQPALPPNQSLTDEDESSAEVELNEIELDFDRDAAEPESNERLNGKLKMTEAEIARLEAQQLNPTAPKSKEEFVSLLMAAPDSSYLWVKFIEFHFANGDLDAAKATAERALERLPIGATDEKINVWIAFINLTVLTAPADSFMAECKPLVQRAAQSTDAKRIWSHFAVFVSANRAEFAPLAWKQALKRCRGSVKVWMRYFEVLMRAEKAAEAREELKRALDSMGTESRKYWKLQEKFAILEFKSNNVEHGRTLFDFVLQNRPKQFDYWCVYADMEAKYGDAEHTRAVYDRIARLTLSPERMRSVLRKWIEFETKNGNDPKRKAYIKQIAVDYKAQQGA